jgi:peptidyl-prolyl cis-trans isomerase C
MTRILNSRGVQKTSVSLFFLFVGLFSIPATSADSAVATYNGLQIGFEEFKYMVDHAPATVQSEAKSNAAARYELLADLMVSKSILRKTESLNINGDSDNYYKFQFQLIQLVKAFDKQLFQDGLEIPNLDSLALERYRVSKEEIARKPETRQLSHILLLCTESCDVEKKKTQLQELRQRLVEGDSFPDIAAEFSQDPGSRQRGGRLSRPIGLEDENVDEAFRLTAFSLSQPGDLSEIVQSRFGLHVMRLEEVNVSRLYTFEEIKPALLKELEARYREDAYAAYFLSLAPDDNLHINGGLVDTILGPLPNASAP